MKIPSDRKFTQLNEGDTFGVLRESRNMSFETSGKARLSRKAISLMDSNIDADFAYVLAINYFANGYVFVTDDEIFKGGLMGAAFTQIAGSPNITMSSDSVIFNGYMYVTIDNNFSRWDGVSTWNNTLGSLTSNVPHPMAIFDSQTTYKLAIGNGNLLHTYDTSHNLNSTILTLPSQFQITTIRYRNGYMYIGTRNINGGEARVFIWDGNGANAQYECPVGADWIFSMTEYDTSVAVVTSQGYLLQITGTTYKTLAKFPIASYPDLRWQGLSGLVLNGKVFNRGMTSIGKNIYINIEGQIDTGFIPEMKSGLWVFDPMVGLTHRASATTDRTRSDTSLSVSNSIITTSFTHNLVTGDTVTFSGIDGLTGVSEQYIYYVTVLSATTFKLSLSRRSLVRQQYVTIAGTPTVSDVLVLAYNTEYGSDYEATSGAVFRTVYAETPLQNWTSEVIWTCRTVDQNSDSVYVANIFNDAYNIGSMTFQRVYSENIEQSFKSIYAFIDGLKVSNEKVVFKAQTRYHDIPRISLQGVWLDENTINTTNSDQYSFFGDIEDGDEIVLVDGYGQGRTCHVAEGGITNSASVYSITVDEDIGFAGEPIIFYVTNFKKIGSRTVTDKAEHEFVKSGFPTNKASAWLSLKIELRGFGISINVLDLLNAIKQGGV